MDRSPAADLLEDDHGLGEVRRAQNHPRRVYTPIPFFTAPATTGHSHPPLSLISQLLVFVAPDFARYDPNPDPVSLSGPRRLTEVVEDNPSLAKDCALLPPEAFYPYPDNSAKLEEKCLRLLAERAGAEEVEACARVLHLLRQEVKMAGGGGEGELGHPVGTYAVHHWTHTWIPRHKGKFESHTVGGG